MRRAGKRKLRSLGLNSHLLKIARSSTGAGHLARRAAFTRPSLTPRCLASGFFLPSDLAAGSMLLTSTAGCGKPHVRWSGRAQVRNPPPPTRSPMEAPPLPGFVTINSTKLTASTDRSSEKRQLNALPAVSPRPAWSSNCWPLTVRVTTHVVPSAWTHNSWLWNGRLTAVFRLIAGSAEVAPVPDHRVPEHHLYA